MGIRINWNAVTAVCAIFVALFTASGWLTDGLREDIRDLREGFAGMRQEMREGFAELRQELAGVRQESRKDNKDLRQEMREGFAMMREDIAEIREDVEVLQQDVAFIKGRILPDQTTNGNTQHSDSR